MENGTLSEEVKRLRSLAKMSQASLATACGVSQPYIARIELGRKSFRLASPLGVRISQALGVPMSHWARFTSDGEVVDKLAEDAMQIPVMGLLANEEPDNTGELEVVGTGEVLNVRLKFPVDCFVLRVAGWSFCGFGIFNGDHIVVVPTSTREEGRLVVVNRGNGFTLKGCRGGMLWEWKGDHGLDVEHSSTQVKEDVEIRIVGYVDQVIGDRYFVDKRPYIPSPH